MTDDFFRNRFYQTIDLRNPLVVLVNLMLWHEIEAAHAQCWACQLKAGKKIEDLDLIGPVSDVARGTVSNAGRPGLPIRLMEAPLYLTHAFNESDEEVIQRRGVTPTWRYFSGDEYFEFQWPCEPTPLGRLRKSLVEEGDAFHAVLCALGFNIRWLLWMIAKEGMGLLKASGLTGLIEKMAEIIGRNRLQNSGQHWALA